MILYYSVIINLSTFTHPFSIGRLFHRQAITVQDLMRLGNFKLQTLFKLQV